MPLLDAPGDEAFACEWFGWVSVLLRGVDGPSPSRDVSTLRVEGRRVVDELPPACPLPAERPRIKIELGDERASAAGAGGGSGPSHAHEYSEAQLCAEGVLEIKGELAEDSSETLHGSVRGSWSPVLFSGMRPFDELRAVLAIAGDLTSVG